MDGRQHKDLILSFWPWIGQNPVTRMFITLYYAWTGSRGQAAGRRKELREDEKSCGKTERIAVIRITSFSFQTQALF